MYHGLTVHPGCWIVLRLDGRSFGRYTRAYAKPFDAAFSRLMTEVAGAVLTDLAGVYAYTESDEVSVLLPRASDLFDRSVEKLVSLSAATASVALTARAEPGTFDSRVWVGADADEVVDYFAWRQADAHRCALNGWAYWTLRGEGQTAAAATAALSGLSTAEKNELLFARGVNYDDTPRWQRHGVGLYWRDVPHTGVNPLTGETAETTRRRLVVDGELPRGVAYREFVREFVGSP